MKEEIEAGAELVRRFNEFRPVKVAFWAKPSDDAYRYLYLALDGLRETGVGPGISEIRRLEEQMRNEHLSRYRVKQIDSSEPLAREVIETRDHFPLAVGTRLGEMYFGRVFLDDVYIYPALSAAASSEGGG